MAMLTRVNDKVYDKIESRIMKELPNCNLLTILYDFVLLFLGGIRKSKTFSSFSSIISGQKATPGTHFRASRFSATTAMIS